MKHKGNKISIYFYNLYAIEFCNFKTFLIK